MRDGIFLELNFDDTHILTLREQSSLKPFTFVYQDDISFLCDMAKIEFNQSYAITSEGTKDSESGAVIPPLTGTEKVKLSFGNDQEDKAGKIEVEMDIFKIQEKPSSPGGGFQSMVITLVNSKLMKLVKPAKNRSFQGKYSDVAQKLAEEAGFASNRMVIENTNSSKSILQPYWTDAQLLKKMSESALGSQNKSSPFIYHVRENDFHFHSFEFIQKGEKFLVPEIFGYPKVIETKDPKEEEKERNSIAIDWISTIRNKYYLAVGGAGMTGGGFDFSKGYVLKKVTGDEVFKENQQLGSSLPAKTDEMDSGGRFEYTGRANMDDVEGYLKSSISSSQQNMVELEVLLRGKAERKSCRIIPFQYLSMSGEKESKYSGDYFIKSAIHVIQNGEYYNKLILIRSGYEDITTGDLVRTNNVRG